MNNKNLRIWTGSLLVTALFWMTAIVHAAIDTSTLTQADSTSITTTITYKSFNRATLDAVYEVDVTNISSTAVTAPVYLVISALPAGVTVPDAAGTTSGGDPYYVLSSADIAAGAIVTQNVTLYNPNNVVLSFTPAVYSTPGVKPLTVMITKPATLITVGSTPLPIEGTVSDPTAMLTVNGAPITINSDGTFKADVALREGLNAIVARAVSSSQDSSATISVALDLTPPYITVSSPLDGAVVSSKYINVSGLVNDIVRGTVSTGQANVTVNGVAATVSNRTYMAQNVELVEGVNTITIQASDMVGNTSSKQTTVTYKVPGTKHIEYVSGQNQTAHIHETLANPFEVKLFDENGKPAAQQPVVFRVTEGDGQVGVGNPDQSQAVVVQTDANGIASTSFQSGTRAGDGNNHAVARAVGYDGQVDFYATAQSNPAAKVSVNTGNNQRGAAKQPLPIPFVVAVTDDGDNVINGAQVEFKVTQGSGTFANGQTSYIATTDSDGLASAQFLLGSELGLDVQRVTATLVGTNLYAGFSASALAEGDPGNTSISGVVLDNQDHPLPGVTVHILNTTRDAVTDVQGQFKITSAPVGPVHLLVDGSTTTVTGEWPTLAFNLVTVAGADNPLRAPVYMVKLDTKHSVWVGAEDQDITVPQLPGFKLTVKKGSVTFPNGDHEGYMSVTPVNASKIPMPPPNGMQPKVIVTIQPTGTRFDPPAPLQVPNVDGYAPGAQVEMFSFDHDLEQFVTIGFGTVSNDGTVIKSNPGVGVVKAGWHGSAPPPDQGCAAHCGECQVSDANCNCVPGGSPSASSDTKGDCKKPECQSGGVVQVPDDNDPPDSTKQCSTCDNGSVVNQPDGTTCDDGKFCTSADGKTFIDDNCQNGICEGKKIDTSDTYQNNALDFDLTELKHALEGTEPISFLHFCTLSPYAFTGAIKIDLGQECCESSQGLVVSQKYHGSAGVEAGAKCTFLIPIPAFPAVQVGGFISIKVAGEVEGTGKDMVCDGEKCSWEVAGNVNLTGSGGVAGALIDKDLLEVDAGISLTGKLEVKDECGAITAHGCVGPPSAFIKVIAAGWISYTFSTPKEWTENWVKCE